VATIGYALSCEEHPPSDLVQHAIRAEAVGFAYASISDHFHPWIDRQGNSPFVWGVLGAIANATSHLKLNTGVTCPIMRYHPAIIAQAAATTECLMPGRFTLGLGTGEALNEHIVGQRWPSAAERREMLGEAVEIIRMLFSGENVRHRGCHFTVDNARIYSMPDEPPPIAIAGGGEMSAEMAGQMADAFVNYSPDPEVVKAFESHGGAGKPKYVQLNVCWAQNEKEARETALRTVPSIALPGQLGQELPLPRHYEQATQLVTEDQIAEIVTCGPDPERHVAAIQKCLDAGYDHVHVDQVGPDQEGFFQFYEREVLPQFR
jgi:coenzyme F420-dependent glucose-6-phosphate dehydrogenase